MTERCRHLNSRTVGCIAVAIAGLILSWIRIPTSLGVKVVATAGLGGIEYDKTGHERIWRVWWRARDDIFEVHAQWLLTAAFIAMLAVFLMCTLAAVWIALSPEESERSSLADETA